MNIVNFARKVAKLINLEPELENHEIIYNEIKKGSVFKGTNLWILFFAIIIASVGLNVNSTAVIIGAMLISPLMGPINGMGYSIATFDFELFRKSVKHYTFAIIVGLLGSTFYFSITPISTAHSELLARTSPTIYDVLIALFGGFAGIVAISSRQKGNVIPGVAIATALMPPLCTAGYGLATGKLFFFFGAFYLFTINTIFIAIAAFLVCKLLNFPIRTIVDPEKKRKINRVITLIALVVLLPSIYFGFKLVKEEKFLQNAKKYISSVSDYEGNFLLKSDVNPKTNTISMIYGGAPLSDEQKNEIIQKAKAYNIENAKIIIQEGLKINKIDDSNFELYQLKEQLVKLNIQLAQKNSELDSIKNRLKIGFALYEEIKPFFPKIINIHYAETLVRKDTTFSDSVQTIPIIVVTTVSNIKTDDKKKIQEWLLQRLNVNDLKIFYDQVQIQK